MAANVKRKFATALGLCVVMVLAVVCVTYYVIVGEVEISFAQKPNPSDSHEAGRKLKILEDAQAGNRNGFIRLSEVEINSLLQPRGGKPAQKDRTEKQVELVQSAVLLHEERITFISWQRVSLLGMQLPVVWQRDLAVERNTNGWRLALQGMRIGKAVIPDRLWTDVTRFLGVTDNTFNDRKAWLATIPTLMLARNEVSQKPELRVYTYVPVVKESANPLSLSEQSKSTAPASTNTLTAKLTL